MTTKTQKPTLLWDENGQIGCTERTHAPYSGSDTWRTGRWRPIMLVEVRTLLAVADVESLPRQAVLLAAALVLEHEQAESLAKSAAVLTGNQTLRERASRLTPRSARSG